MNSAAQSLYLSFGSLAEIRERNYVKFPWRDITPDQLKSKIKRLIEDYTGTGFDIKYMVTEFGKPNPVVIEFLSTWMTDRALYFADNCPYIHDRDLYNHDYLEGMYYGFFRLFFYGAALNVWPDRSLESVNELARAIEKDSDLMPYIFDCENATEAQDQLKLDAFRWQQKHGFVHGGFAGCVQAAAAAFVGMCDDPLAEKPEIRPKGTLEGMAFDVIDLGMPIALVCHHSGMRRGGLDFEYNRLDDRECAIALKITDIVDKLIYVDDRISELEDLVYGLDDDDDSVG